VSGEASARSAAVAEWLESPYLSRIASRVAYEYGLHPQDVPDLLQDLCLALWIAGPNTAVNATWIFRTAGHKAMDVLKRRRRLSSRAKPDSTASSSPRLRDPDLSHLLRSRAARLPDKLRRFYRLRYCVGLSQREIGQQLGMCRSSVRWLELRCLRMMKGRLPCQKAGAYSLAIRHDGQQHAEA
jgi:RNA polymerase sigma factor (sigma-70 family)